MGVVSDKLSRISALQPNQRLSKPAPGYAAAANSEKLIRLIEGECRANRLGSHIRVRRRFPQPTTGTLDSKGLQLLVPFPVDTICDPAQWLFLDIETTGLAGGTGTYAFLVGLAWWEEEDGFVVEQYFMRDHCDEPSLLLEVLDRLVQRRVLVTYNGKSFDWPLLQTRFQMTRLGPVPEPLAHLDFLHPARQIWRLRLKSVALEQLERQVLQLNREQDIPSSTIPQRYFDFLRGGSPDAIADVFRHNQMDLCGLASLALHITHILANPEPSNCGATELFGISRLLQRRGRAHLAGSIYRRALEGGLPKSAERIALRELALLAKRERNFAHSNALWEKLLDGSTEGLQAYEQLAIHYEHYESLPNKAAALSGEALIRLQEAFRAGRLPSRKYYQWHAKFHHRLARLRAKIEKSDTRRQESE
jgi:uncharacterized protein YprB with RNaseH-like and TPR domain